MSTPLCKCGRRCVKEFVGGTVVFTCLHDSCSSRVIESDFIENPNLCSVKSNAEFKFINRDNKFDRNMNKFYSNLLKNYKFKLGDIKRLYKSRKYTDSEIYGRMRKVLYKCGEKEKFQQKKPERENFRNNFRNRDVKRLIPQDLRPSCMLDYGCGDGKLTQFFGEQFNLPKEKIFGCDVIDTKNERISFFQVKGDDTRLPFEDDSVDLIFSFMCLHHVKNVDFVVSELHRIINKKIGVLIIREHDLEDEDLNVFLDVVHGTYAMVFSDPPENAQWRQNYFAKYLSREDWKKKLDLAGFALLDETDTVGIFRSFYFAFIPNCEDHANYKQRKVKMGKRVGGFGRGGRNEFQERDRKRQKRQHNKHSSPPDNTHTQRRPPLPLPQQKQGRHHKKHHPLPHRMEEERRRRPMHNNYYQRQERRADFAPPSYRGGFRRGRGGGGGNGFQGRERERGRRGRDRGQYGKRRGGNGGRFYWGE